MKHLYVIAISVLCIYNTQGQTWTQKSDFGGSARRYATGFSLGLKGYIGTGANNDFWEYDPSTDIWTQKANVGGPGRNFAIGFSAAGKGYIGLGNGAGGDFCGYLKDFWEYEPATNVWSQKVDFPDSPRRNIASFSINDKGYLVTGIDCWDGYKRTVHEYDPKTGQWTQKSNFPSFARGWSTGFSIGNKGYVGTGGNDNNERHFNDFWQYDPSTDNWTQMADFGGEKRLGAVSFGIDGKGYIGTGILSDTTQASDFWEYDTLTNSWIQIPDLPGGIRENAVAFSIESKGYVGTGFDGTSTKKDFWEYTPAHVVTYSSEKKESLEKIKVEQLFPNPVEDILNIIVISPKQDDIKINVYNSLGKVKHTQSYFIKPGKSKIALDLPDLESGIYSISILPSGVRKGENIKFVVQ